MEKKLLGVCGFLLFGTFGMLSGVAQVHDDEPDASSETSALQGDGLQRQEMSDEEKERRREECQRSFDYCVDWCDRTKGGKKCEAECMKKIEECMKKIPSNPKPDPDY
jgi:hypothetical protein